MEHTECLPDSPLLGGVLFFRLFSFFMRYNKGMNWNYHKENQDEDEESPKEVVK